MNVGAEMVYVGRVVVLNRLARLLVTAGFMGFHLYAYTTIPDPFTDTFLAKGFLVYIILFIIPIISALVDIVVAFFLYGQTIQKSDFESRKAVNRPAWQSVTIVSSIVMLVFCIYVIDLFIPLGTCNVFESAPYACISMKIIAVSSLFCFACLGLICCLGCCIVASGVGQSDHDVLIPIVLHPVSHPVSNVPPPNGECCVICIQDPKPEDEWSTLPCNHKFHPECIRKWLVLNPTCPTCRADSV